MPACRFQSVLIPILAVVMLLGGMFYFGKGVYRAWFGTNLSEYLHRPGEDCDLQARADEYAEFVRKIYPNRRLTQPGKPRASAHTVYPPYALPMFGLFFGYWSYETGRIILQLSSFLSLAALTWFGWSCLCRYGTSAGLLGSALPWIFSGNREAMTAGQFSIVCAGLLALQLMALANGGALRAGACWALAMLKPHIALPFAVLFITRKQVRGLVLGVLLLGGLSIFALWWTDLGVVDFLRHGPTAEKLNFAKNQYGAGVWIDYLGLNPRLAIYAGIILLGFVTLSAVLLSRNLETPLLPSAAMCSVLGFVLFYHGRYDNIMLFPLAYALLDVCFRRALRMPEWLAYGAFFLSVFLPRKFVPQPLIATDVATTFELLAPVFAAVVFLLYVIKDRELGPSRDEMQ